MALNDESSNAEYRSKPRFFRAGGMDQLCLEEGKDLEHVLGLDPKLWVALSCPTTGLTFDKGTLAFLDVDKDGRVRQEEVVAAVDWTLKMLRSPDKLHLGEDTLELELINTDHVEGQRLLQAAQRVLNNLGKAESSVIKLEDTLAKNFILATSGQNGDGVVTADSTDDPAVQLVIQDIMATIGKEVDRSGAEGVTESGVAQFFAALESYRNWRREIADKEQSQEILPFGDETEIVFSALAAVKEPIETFFAQCRIATVDDRASEKFSLSSGQLEALSASSSQELDLTLSKLPIAPIRSRGCLTFAEVVNPYYQEALQRFREKVVVRIFGNEKESINESDWETIKKTFLGYRKWTENKEGLEVEPLGINRIEGILKSGCKKKLLELIKIDQKLGDEIQAIAEVEKLIRYSCFLFPFVNNYVSFPRLYDLNVQAIFQAGRLFIDSRELFLCVDVEDASKHSNIGKHSGVYLVYCELTRAGFSNKRTVAAAVTSGTGRRLFVGKNGVFFDREGYKWDATVTLIVSHAISLREAAWAPFKRLGDLVSSQIEKITSSREKSLQAGVSSGMSQIGNAADQKSTGSGAGGLLAGGGVAIAALSSSFAFISSTLSNIDKVYFLYTAVIFLTFIILPSMIMGYLKLRARDLSQILEAHGWAINGPMRLGLPLARALSEPAAIPLGSRRSQFVRMGDGVRVVRWWLWVALVLSVALYGYLNWESVLSWVR